jgi:putative zinc finger/helix-turn-helix YgiT family protein
MTNTTCFQCGEADFQIQRMVVQGSRNNETFDVEVDGMACPKCGCRTMNAAQGEAMTHAVSAAYRQRYGLLTEADILLRREAANMTQTEFAVYLGVGVASVKRWESGQIQDKAMDELIRLKTDPDAARRNFHSVQQLFAGKFNELTATSQ